ncbi:unnamed protein product, partial [Iphiclides podalirius]
MMFVKKCLLDPRLGRVALPTANHHRNFSVHLVLAEKHRKLRVHLYRWLLTLLQICIQIFCNKAGENIGLSVRTDHTFGIKSQENPCGSCQQ